MRVGSRCSTSKIVHLLEGRNTPQIPGCGFTGWDCDSPPEGRIFIYTKCSHRGTAGPLWATCRTPRRLSRFQSYLWVPNSSFPTSNIRPSKFHWSSSNTHHGCYRIDVLYLSHKLEFKWNDARTDTENERINEKRVLKSTDNCEFQSTNHQP